MQANIKKRTRTKQKTVQRGLTGNGLTTAFCAEPVLLTDGAVVWGHFQCSDLLCRLAGVRGAKQDFSHWEYSSKPRESLADRGEKHSIDQAVMPMVVVQ